jgi:ABC-type antimicrobial peptide transport system permease subunit
MFKHSLRTFVHYRLYSIINLLGLALSLTCVVIIARYVYSELTVDGFNMKMDRIYISTLERSSNPGKLEFFGGGKDEQYLPGIFKHPGVEKHASFMHAHNHEIACDNQVYGVEMLIVDSVFLQILDYSVITGANNIRRPEDVILTETFATKLFGKEDPAGKTLFFPTLNKMITVAGVIRPPANKSVLSFDILVNGEINNWGYGLQSLILLYPGVDYHELNSRHSEFTYSGTKGYRYQFFPYKDVYFSKDIRGYMFAHGKIVYIFILLGTGLLLLLIGLINYINIHSVVMIRRGKEFGMKKIFGAGSGRIFVQLYVENLLLTVVSLAIAFWLVAILSPFVENVFGIRQYLNLRFDICLALILTVLFPAVVSIAPALRYRYFSPLRSLRSVNAGNRSLFSRKFFLCFQYFMTMGLIVVSLFFVRQLNFMLDNNPGYRTQNIIKVPFLTNSSSVVSNRLVMKDNSKIYEALRQRLNESPLLECWSMGDRFPVGGTLFKEKFIFAGKEIQCSVYGNDETWFKIFGVQLLDGRLWDNETDRFGTYNIIVTESALKQFGIADYREAQMESVNNIWFSKENKPYNIVGVVKDFQVEHLSQYSDPAVFVFYGQFIEESVIASFAPNRRQEVIAFMKNLHDELVGGDFTYSFIEDEVAALYKEDKKVAMTCTVFTGVAILVSMLGLFGVSLFDIRRRRREIAIRKINGAQIIDIVRLLLKNYFALLALAFAVSIPVALFAIHKYLENFANKASIAWWLFAVALVVTLAVSLLTLLYQTYKAGNENPADVIKSEV